MSFKSLAQMLAIKSRTSVFNPITIYRMPTICNTENTTPSSKLIWMLTSRAAIIYWTFAKGQSPC